MKNSIIKILTLILAAMLIFSGCAPKNEEQPPNERVVEIFGDTVDGKYKNNYFGITANVPKAWHVMSYGEKMEELISGMITRELDYEEFKSKLDEGEVEMAQMLMASRHDPNSILLGTFNFDCTIAVFAEKYSILDVNNPKEYISKIVDGLNDQEEENEVELIKAGQTNLSGKTMESLTFEIHDRDLSVVQTYYVYSYDEYNVCIVTSHISTDEKAKAELSGFINSINITK